MRIRIALAVSLVLTAIAVLHTLSAPALTVGRTNMGAPESEDALLATVTAVRLSVCQRDESVPGGTSALHLAVRTDTLGPKLTLRILAGTRLVAEGAKAAGWRGPGVTVPVKRVARSFANVTICFQSSPLQEQLRLRGTRTGRAVGLVENGHRIAGRMKLQYLRAGSSSWLSQARAIARRMGLGYVPSGSVIALLLAGAMLAIVVLASWLLLHELDPEQPRAQSQTVRTEVLAKFRPKVRAEALPTVLPEALPTVLPKLRTELPRRRWLRWGGALPAVLCMTIAFLNAAGWSLISPPFQVEDEEAHFAYVQQLAERRALPREDLSEPFSAEEEVALRDLRFDTLRVDSSTHTIGSRAEHAELEHDLDSQPSRLGSGNAGVAASEPPLYYALETIPYALGAGGNILLRIELMRLCSALMAAATALFVFLFLREALPRTRWAWSVGGLLAGLTPLLASMSGAINPDALLAAVAAATFYLLARGFRRGLSRRLAIALGAVLAVGFVSKLNFLGLAPGALIGLALLARRAARELGAVAYRRLAVALALAISPIVLYALIALLSDAGGLDRLWGAIPNPFPHGLGFSELSYLWQTYLPPLPGMARVFPGVVLWREVWLVELTGNFGWDDIYFRDWVEQLALIPALAIGVLAVRSLVLVRVRVRARAGELSVYLLMALGLLAMIALASYQVHPEEALEYRMARYLLPLLALGCAIAVLAARGAGRRWGPVVGVVLVVLVLAQDLFSQLLVIARYYG